MNAVTAIAKKFQAARRQMLIEAGNMAVNHFKDSFQNQGFTYATLDKWKEVQRREKNEDGSYKYDVGKYWGGKRFYIYSKRDRTRNILVKTGRLSRSIRRMPPDINSGFVDIVTDVPYAQAHNEGTKRIPKREFMGYSPKLALEMMKAVTLIAQNALKQ